jgi:hypothetical protein
VTGSGLFHTGPETAFLPAAQAVYADLAAHKQIHRFVLHRRSSQAFALNLFAPLTDTGRQAALAALGLDAITVEPAVFEYSDPADRLAEAKPHSPHRTQVDVLLRGTDAQGARLCALIEVKFTETDFGGCSAYTNPVNPHRDVCRTAGLFGNNTDRCFQLANHGAGQRRRYDTYLANNQVHLPDGASDGGGCLVRAGLNQPMRNLALAHLLLAEGETERVAYALCAPARHHTIWRRFAEARAAFPDTPNRTLVALTAGQVASMHPDRGTALAALYPIDEIDWPCPTLQ